MFHMLKIVFLCLAKLAASRTLVHMSPGSSLVGVQITIANLLITSHRRYNCQRKKCSVFFDTPRFLVKGPTAELSIRNIIGPVSPFPTLSEYKSLSNALINWALFPAKQPAASSTSVALWQITLISLQLQSTAASHMKMMCPPYIRLVPSPLTFHDPSGVAYNP